MISLVGNFHAEIWQDVHCFLEVNLKGHRDLLITAREVSSINLINMDRRNLGQTLDLYCLQWVQTVPTGTFLKVNAE